MTTARPGLGVISIMWKANSGWLIVLLLLLGACTDRAGPPGAADPSPGEPSPGSRPQIGSWRPLADLPQARTELSAVAHEGRVYVAGGFSAGPGGEAFFRYDPAQQAWSELAPLPAQRHHAPLAAYGGEVYVVGGYSHHATTTGAGFSPTDTLFIYDIATDTWREGPPLPEAVGAHAVATTSTGTIHVLGGVGDSQRSLDLHLAFDPGAGTWSALPALPTAREHLGAAYLDGIIYTVAGRNGGFGVAFEAYDLRSREWTALPPLPTARSGVAVVAFEEQLYVFGGETFNPNRTYDHAERYDPATGAWQEITPMPSARHGLGAVALDDGIVVIGGGPTAGISFSAATEIWRP